MVKCLVSGVVLELVVVLLAAFVLGIVRWTWS